MSLLIHECIKRRTNLFPHADAPFRCRVVRCLIPKSTVPCSAVLSLLGSLNVLPLSLQQLVFKWIILVYDLIDDRDILHTVYDGLFYYLQYDALRPLVCQLLCYLTSRQDGELAVFYASVTHFSSFFFLSSLPPPPPPNTHTHAV